MANLWRNRCWDRFMRSHQYVCALESIVHLDSSHEVPLAFRDRYFNHPSHYHDRGITTRERQDCMGMRPWGPALDCICRIRCPSFGFLAHWLLCSRVLESQYCLHRFTSGGHRLPGLHVLFDLAILKAARALLEYARAFPRRVLQGLSARYYLADVGHDPPLSPVWDSVFLQMWTFLMIPQHVRYDTYDLLLDDALVFTMTYYFDDLSLAHAIP